MDIWDLVIAETKKITDESQLPVKQSIDETNLLFVGSRKTGKTTVIYRFLNRDEPPKPTLALEYTFGRQTRANVLSKDVCHIWELGGGTLFTSLLEIPISTKAISNLAVVVVMDLSSPHELLVSLTTLLDALKKRIVQVLESMKLREEFERMAWERLGNDHQDKKYTKPFPVPLVIIGGKYDAFQNFEPEHCKIICRTLRYFAHVNGASLLFFSNRMENLVTRTRALLSHLAFGTVISSNYISQDHNKPLVIPAGADSLQQIGSISGVGRDSNSTDDWKKAYESCFPQSTGRLRLPEDPAKDPNFKETVIDDLRAQKDDELEHYKRKLVLHKGHTDE